MSKKKTVVAFITGGLFALVICLVAGFDLTTWQFWAIFLAGAATKLPDALN